MKRGLCFVLGLVCLLLLLSSCRAAQKPPSGGIGSARALFVSRLENGEMRVEASIAQRAGVEAKPIVGQGASLAAAIAQCRLGGEQSLSLAHVEHWVLDEGAARVALEELFSYAFQNGEQSAEAKLWVLQGEREALFAVGERPDARLSALQTAAQEKRALPCMSIRDLAGKWAEDQTILLPALRLDTGELRFEGYRIWQEGDLTGALYGDAARGASLLLGREGLWVETLLLADERQIAVEMKLIRTKVLPQMQEKMLKGVQLESKLEARLVEGFLSEEERAQIEGRLERRVGFYLDAATTVFRLCDADAVNLRRQAALRRPWQWTQIKAQWDEGFARLSIDTRAFVRLAEK